MSNLLLSPEAEQDLIDIWFYIAQDSPVNADRYVDKLEAKGQLLAESPDIGIKRPELMPGLHSFAVDQYILFYRKDLNGIELIRVLYASRDIQALF